MKFELDRAVEILERTPAVLRSMLTGLSEPWIQNNYGEKTFSPFDVVGHLIHGERTDWIPRARIILERGEARTFEPFDRYAQFTESQGKTIGELLATWTVHDLNHIHQIAKCMAWQYKDGMGPWKPHVGVLKPNSPRFVWHRFVWHRFPTGVFPTSRGLQPVPTGPLPANPCRTSAVPCGSQRRRLPAAGPATGGNPRRLLGSP